MPRKRRIGELPPWRTDSKGSRKHGELYTTARDETKARATSKKVPTRMVGGDDVLLPPRAVHEDRTATVLTNGLNCRHVYRIRILGDFLTTYYPSLHQGVWPSGWLLRVPGTPAYSSLFTTATDALCYGYLGTVKQDTGLLFASHLAYARVVEFLKESLKQPLERWRFVDHREVVVSIFTLSLLDSAIPTYQSGSNSWMAHWDAAHQFVTVRGPSCFNMQDPFMETMLMQVFHGAAFLGVSRRKGLESAGSAWADRKTWGRSGGLPIWALLNLPPNVAAVPGLLEQADFFLAQEPRPDDQTEFGKLFDQIVETQENLRSDMEIAMTHTAPQLIETSDEQAFNLEIEEHCFISSSDTMPYQYDFRSSRRSAFQACDAYIRSCVYRLLLQCTVLRVFHARQELKIPSAGLYLDAMEQQAYDLAMELCRTVYQMSLHSSMALPQGIVLYLGLAQTVFEEQDAHKEMGWCQATIIAARMRLQRLSKSQSPTLGTIEDLPRGIALGGRYKTKKSAVY